MSTSPTQKRSPFRRLFHLAGVGAASILLAGCYTTGYGNSGYNYGQPQPNNQNNRVLGECTTGDVLVRGGLGAIVGDAIDDQNGARAGAAVGAASCLTNSNRYGDPYYRQYPNQRTNPYQRRAPHPYGDPNYRGQERCYEVTARRGAYGQQYNQRECIDHMGRTYRSGPIYPAN